MITVTVTEDKMAICTLHVDNSDDYSGVEVGLEAIDNSLNKSTAKT